MKFTIEGFNQERLMKLGLDVKDAMILRYFVDFKDATTKAGKPAMISKVIDSEKYYWVKYEGIIKELPILKLGNVDSVYRRLIKMVKVKVLDHATIKQGGTYSYYKTGINYAPLISDSSELVLSDENPNGKVSDKNPIGSYPQKTVKKLPYSDKNPTGTDGNPIETDKNPNHSDEKSEQKINLLYPSTNNPSTKNREVFSSNNLDNFFNSIKNEMTEVSYKTWIEPLEIKEEENKIQVVTTSDFTKTMIKNKFIEIIQIHLKKYFEFEHIEVVCSEKLKEG